MTDDQYKKHCRQHFKMNPDTMQEMYKKADRMKQRKITAEQLAEANRKHDEQFNSNDRVFSKAVKNSVWTEKPTPVAIAPAIDKKE